MPAVGARTASNSHREDGTRGLRGRRSDFRLRLCHRGLGGSKGEAHALNLLVARGPVGPEALGARELFGPVLPDSLGGLGLGARRGELGLGQIGGGTGVAIIEEREEVALLHDVTRLHRDLCHDAGNGCRHAPQTPDRFHNAMRPEAWRSR